MISQKIMQHIFLAVIKLSQHKFLKFLYIASHLSCSLFEVNKIYVLETLKIHTFTNYGHFVSYKCFCTSKDSTNSLISHSYNFYFKICGL